MSHSFRRTLTFAAAAIMLAGVAGTASAATSWQKSHPRSAQVHHRLGTAITTIAFNHHAKSAGHAGRPRQSGPTEVTLAAATVCAIASVAQTSHRQHRPGIYCD